MNVIMNVAMTRFWKIFGALALSLALLYSSVAWAFLRCSHEKDFSEDGGKVEDPLQPLEASEAPELECLHHDYQIGPVITSTSSPRVFTDGVRLETSSGAGDLKIFLPGFFLERSPLYFFLNGLARHILLSVFRI